PDGAGAGLPYDQALDGYDRNQPLQIRSLAYTISVRENGWPAGLFPSLTPIPEHPQYGPRVLGAPSYPTVLPPNAPLPRPPPAINPCLSCPPPPDAVTIHQPPLSFEVPPQFSDDQVYQMQSMLVQLCEQRNDRFALLDPTAAMAEDASQGVALVQEWRNRFE